ncbi:UNVERIFIED_CONTAM: putative glycosyl hydrolase [Acetivibrio alkalicellulosi]
MKKLIAIVIFIGFGVILTVAIQRFYTTGHLPNNEVIPAFYESGLNLVVEDEHVIFTDKPKIIDGEILLPFDLVKKYFDPHIFWDEEVEKVTITTKDRVIRMKTNNLEAFVNNKPIVLNIPVIKENDKVYIPIEFLSDFYNIDTTFVAESSVIIIDYKAGFKQIATPIEAGAVIRSGRSDREPIIRKFDAISDEEENKLRIFEEYDNWYKVRTWDGAIGFIEKRYVVAKIVMDRDMEKSTQESLWEVEYGKINLVWDMVYTRREDPWSVGEMKGLDVISPTWFQLKNQEGDLINRAYSKYVEWAHDNGYKVWALLSNDFQDPDMTSKFLNNTESRENLIKQILAYSALYKLDGINIDFENFYERDRDAFTQFMRELTPILKEQGLIVSVDVNDIPCYDKKALSDIVDYVMYMSYDQHWRTSPVAGSVAQVTWQERILKRVLEVEKVPREKLLLGLPFYTRLWQEEIDENGQKKLSNVALSMKDARNKIIKNNATTVWDDVSGQFYAQYEKDNSTFKIWLEDANSINLKTSLVHKYRLAGTCAWSRNFVSPEIWDVLYLNLKEIKSYQEWNELNQQNEYIFLHIY